MIEVSIFSLIYESEEYADWVYNSVKEFTPMLKNGKAEFVFIANDPSSHLVKHLAKKKYKFIANYNKKVSEQEMYKMGYAKPEYIRRVYQGYNEAILRSVGDRVVLINSDNYFSPNWLENLIKNHTKNSVVASKIVERRHPKYGVYPAAYEYDCGKNISSFDKNKFLDYAQQEAKNKIAKGGAYMPIIMFKDIAIKAGLFPEGNLAGNSFDQVTNYGDQYFFNELNKLGVKHITSLDSIVYHMKEGEKESHEINIINRIKSLLMNFFR